MFLVRQVLDTQIADCDGHKVGRVDDILLQIGDDNRAVVHSIVTQNGALARLLGERVGRFMSMLQEHMLGVDRATEPVEIGWNHVTRIDVAVHIDLDRDDANLLDVENALWRRWIQRLPFAER